MPLIDRATFGRWLVLASALFIAATTLVPLDQVAPGDPFCILCGELGGVDAILNVVLFVPLGVALTLAGFAWPRSIALAFALSASVELLQYFVVPGRDATLRDVVTNVVGAATGITLAAHWRRLIEPDRRFALVLLLAYGASWIVFQALVAIALQPSLPEGQYHGQIARPRAGETRFSGSVLSAHVGSVSIRDWELPTDSIRAALRARPSVPFRAVVTGWGECPSRTTPIVRIAAGERGYVVSLAQRRNDAVFTVRSRAADLWLRPLRYRLRGAFGAVRCEGGQHMLALEAQHEDNHMTLRASRPDVRLVVRVPRRISDGWRLFTPWTMHVEDSALERLISSAWIAIALLPLGYWAGRILFAPIETPSWTRVATTVVAAIIAICAVGLFVLPSAVHLLPASVLDCFAAGAALAFAGIRARSAARIGER